MPSSEDLRDTSAEGESLTIVLVALVANVLVAVAKSVAALLTGAASMVAEAAHSWADAGNEVFLLVAERRGRKPPDETHPWGHGREVYIWSLFAAIGLFALGAGVSIAHGVEQLANPDPVGSYCVAYVVLAAAFVFEGVSFLQSRRKSRQAARRQQISVVEHLYRTTDPTVRAVVLEDAAALVGIVIAAGAIFIHQVTGSATPDAVGSILIGLLLAVVALLLISRNRAFLVGEVADPDTREFILGELISRPEVDRVTWLHLEVVGTDRLLWWRPSGWPASPPKRRRPDS